MDSIWLQLDSAMDLACSILFGLHTKKGDTHTPSEVQYCMQFENDKICTCTTFIFLHLQ